MILKKQWREIMAVVFVKIEEELRIDVMLRK
jgi:hypothetical protein